MMKAESPPPSTKAGMIRRSIAALGSTKIDSKPEAGSHFSSTATTRISMIPSQKFGIDRPDSASALAE